MPFLTRPVVPGLFVDALLTTAADTLLFLSVWGRDSAAQELFARLSLEPGEEGLSNSNVEFVDPSGHPRTVHMPAKDHLEKITGRMPAHSLFGDGLVHGLIFQTTVQQPDQANQTAVLIHRPDEPESSVEARQWALIQSLCRVPLLSAWRRPVLEAFRDEGWITDLDGFGLVGREYRLKEPERVIGTLMKEGRLPIPKPEAASASHSAMQSTA